MREILEIESRAELVLCRADEEDKKQLSARQRGHSEAGLWDKIASAFNCELTLLPPSVILD